MLKTVDQVINSLSDPEFDKFTSGVIADVSRKLGRDDIAMIVENKQLAKDDKGIPFVESADENPIPA